MRVISEVRRAIDPLAVVEEELATKAKLLPPRWGDVALTGNSEAVAHWLASLLRRDFQVSAEEVLLARKLGRGARPLSLLGLQERLLYRGAVSLIQSPAATVAARSPEAYQAFRLAPLGIPECRYILKTDITAYYQYIDHERLIDEVVAQTGDDLAISAATELLRDATGRAYGLPQQSLVSDILAEIYIEPMRHALVRAGFVVVRFADDFRVACRSYEEAMSAWEAADSAARDLGLVLNESKTLTPGRDRYSESMIAVSDPDRELFSELDLEELETTEYGDIDEWDIEEQYGGGHLRAFHDDADLADSDEEALVEELVEPDEEASPAQLTAARTAVDRWVTELHDNVQRRETAQIRGVDPISDCYGATVYRVAR